MIKPDDIFYTPTLPGKQRAALKRAFRVLQAKRRGECTQFFWVKKKNRRLQVIAGYRRKQKHSRWVLKGEWLSKPKGEPWVYVNTVYRFSIGVRGGIFLQIPKKRYVNLSRL